MWHIYMWGVQIKGLKDGGSSIQVSDELQVLTTLARVASLLNICRHCFGIPFKDDFSKANAFAYKIAATASWFSASPAVFYGRVWNLASFLKRPVLNMAGESDKEFEEKRTVDWKEEDEVTPEIGNGRYGGEVVLGDVPWGERVLSAAHEVLLQLGDDIQLYSFKMSPGGYIHVTLDKLSDKYGFPCREDLENFGCLYKKRLEEIRESGEIPNHELSLRVACPDFERVLKGPEDLVRFKDVLLKVCYIEGEEKAEKVGIFKLVSVETESGECVLRLLDVKENRILLGEGKPLSREQKDWRLRVPFRSLKKVTLY
ncbi:Ribosome maturation factor RimP [Macleaya cordata]|uniref:Ribosome maturation factor RimP n=1 Tax=Macleaya cordata TaxID=56857 RepID=A0A200PRL3_MACCD|nr:Ribosome maturation factor RimP [Macleaya cordata]